MAQWERENTERPRGRQTLNDRERAVDLNWRESVIFAQRGHAPQSGLSLSPVLTPVCVCCGEAGNRGMCEPFVNTNTHAGTHWDTHSHTGMAHAPSVCICIGTGIMYWLSHSHVHSHAQKNCNYRHLRAPVSHSVFKWSLHKAFGGFSSRLFLSPTYV